MLHHHCTPPSLLAPCLQLLFLAGVALTIGFQATLKFFIKKKNYKVRRPVRWALTYSLAVHLLLAGGVAGTGMTPGPCPLLTIPYRSPAGLCFFPGGCGAGSGGLDAGGLCAGDLRLLAALQRLLPHGETHALHGMHAGISWRETMLQTDCVSGQCLKAWANSSFEDICQ